jgi:hypothetical protein
MCVVETGSDRAPGNAEDLGDRRRLVPEVVTKDEDRPLLRRQPAEPALHDIAVDDATELIGRRMTVDDKNLEFRVSASISSSMVDAHVREKALDPEVEPVRIAEARQVTPGDHQCVLQGILGPIDIAKDPSRDREQAIDAAAKEVDEGDLVSALRRDHELSIHRRHHLDARRGRRPHLQADGAPVALQKRDCRAPGNPRGP